MVKALDSRPSYHYVTTSGRCLHYRVLYIRYYVQTNGLPANEIPDVNHWSHLYYPVKAYTIKYKINAPLDDTVC